MDGDIVNVGIGMASKTSAMAQSVTSMDGMNRTIYPGGFASDLRNGTWGMMNQLHGSGFYSEFESRESGGGEGIYDSMALPDNFLGQYYTQVKESIKYFYLLFSVTQSRQ